MASWAPQVEPDTKPVKRHKATAAEWTQMRERFANSCCVACGLAGESLHHVIPKSQSGDDVEQNLVPLCGDGTRGCHGKLENHEPSWERVAAAVRVYVLLDRSRCVYVIAKIGWERFNNRYPLLSESEGHGAQGDPATNPKSSLGHSETASDSESDEFEKPRRSPWEIDFLPPFNSEDIPFA